MKTLTFLLIPLHYENKYYLQVNLDNCAYKTLDKQVNVHYLYYQRIDISKRIDHAKVTIAKNV